jgi:hypothetical protein
MRIFYLIVICLCSLAFSANGQAREEYEVQHGRVDGKSVHLFPNPAVDYVHVRIDKVPAKKITITVHNIIGNEVPVEIEIVSEHELRVRVKDLDSGYYLLAVKDEEDHFRGTYKFVKR